jgi:Tripartite tricarboxylate transporter TctB family
MPHPPMRTPTPHQRLDHAAVAHTPQSVDSQSGWQRPTLAVLAAVLLFGLMVRPLGLAVALPVAIFTSGLASSPVRWLPLAALTVALSAAIAAVAKLLLRLPMPLWPTWPQPLASIFGG